MLYKSRSGSRCNLSKAPPVVQVSDTARTSMKVHRTACSAVGGAGSALKEEGQHNLLPSNWIRNLHQAWSL